MKKIVAYLDILGFESHTYVNLEEAIELLSDYRAILEQKMSDEEIQRSSPCADKRC